ncbi:hypothetical protein V8C86DRAFT_1794395 [Haematococcus lacustris]
MLRSHASNNTNDGINMFDGIDAMYFYSSPKGDHWMWDSCQFNSSNRNWETLRFLPSDARWWKDEYRFDGYRFDGVTSMMCHHHGLSFTFTGQWRHQPQPAGAGSEGHRHRGTGRGKLVVSKLG